LNAVQAIPDVIRFCQGLYKRGVRYSYRTSIRAQALGVKIMTAADVLIETLIDWGVDIVFGLPGDGINGLMESLRTHQDQVRLIQVRHEESAAFIPAPMPNLQDDWACVWQRQVPEEFIFSMVYTMPRWTASQCWRSRACNFMI
jgi:basic membrane lipoprotein Med (substrate-binding protein (PBP1-ABC) superfamily)